MTARQALATGTVLWAAAALAACFGGTAHAERDTPQPAPPAVTAGVARPPLLADLTRIQRGRCGR